MAVAFILALDAKIWSGNNTTFHPCAPLQEKLIMVCCRYARQKKSKLQKRKSVCLCFFNYISAMRMQHISTNQPLLNKGGQKVARM